MNLSEHCHLVNAKAPIADVFAGTMQSEDVDLSQYDHVTFIVQKGVGVTGTSTYTVQAADAASPMNYTAVPFRYKEVTSTDVDPGSLTEATATGFTSTAGSATLIIIEVDARNLANTGYKYCNVKAVEVTDSPVLAGILAVLSGARYANATASQID